MNNKVLIILRNYCHSSKMLGKKNLRSRIDLLFSLNVRKNQLTLVGRLIFFKACDLRQKLELLMDVVWHFVKRSSIIKCSQNSTRKNLWLVSRNHWYRGNRREQLCWEEFWPFKWGFHCKILFKFFPIFPQVKCCFSF